MQIRPSINKAATLLICSLLGSSAIFAQSVEKVKGKAVLLNLDGQNLAVGSEWITVNDVGHKTGLIKIKQVKNGKAVGEIEKGIVASGETLLAKPAAKSRFKPDPDEPPPLDENEAPLVKRKKHKQLGIFAGYAMDTMSFTATNATNSYQESAALSGSAFQLMGFYDYQWSEAVNIRLNAGLDGFAGTYSAKSTVINSGGSANSSLSVTALGFGGDVQWQFYRQDQTIMWAGLGLTMDYVMGTTTNLISLSAPTLVNYLSLGGGADFPMGRNMFIPAAIYYDYFIAGSGITQSAIRLTAGIGWIL